MDNEIQVAQSYILQAQVLSHTKQYGGAVIFVAVQVSEQRALSVVFLCSHYP